LEIAILQSVDWRGAENRRQEGGFFGGQQRRKNADKKGAFSAGSSAEKTPIRRGLFWRAVAPKKHRFQAVFRERRQSLKIAIVARAKPV
jgi:hypothetical protein